eukprot:m.72195 g.72195  ORF g.72195 m.72195 type:complete len:416 (-) comp24435_c1_seq1:182-1429(-)
MAAVERALLALLAVLAIVLIQQRSTHLELIHILQEQAAAEETHFELRSKPAVSDPLVGQLSQLTTKLKECEAKILLPPPPPPLSIPAPPKTDKSGESDEDILSNFMVHMNNLCRVVQRNPAGARKHVVVTTIVFCMGHTAQFRRDYNYAWDKASSTMGYYRGSMLYPYQMSIDQYQVITSTIMEIPHKEVLDQLETTGSVDDKQSARYYGRYNDEIHFKGQTVDKPRGNEGPRVLFMGCGTDVPIWKAIMDLLGGTIIYIETDETWMGQCKNLGADEIYHIKYSHNQTYHQNIISDNPDIGSHYPSLTVPVPIQILNADPFDVIVVDGPGGVAPENEGRPQALYLARSLALSYGEKHFTNIFLHDAAREWELIWAQCIMKHEFDTYMGNTLPRKGLKHWRLRGANTPFKPPIFGE